MQDFSPRDKQRFRCVIDAATPQGHSGDLDQCDFESVFGEGGVSDSDVLFAQKLRVLRQIFTMATDSAWGLRRLDKKRIVGTYHYLATHNQDAMSSIERSILLGAAIDLLEHDCRAELQMYREFCELRRTAKELPFQIRTRTDWLRYKREELQQTGRRFLGMRRNKLIR